MSTFNLHAQAYAEQELYSMQKPFSAAEGFFHFRKNKSEKICCATSRSQVSSGNETRIK